MTDIEYVTACYACAQGLVSECLDPQEQPDGTIIPCIIRFASAERSRDAGGGALSPKDVTDAKSTGRKRAILVAPILEGMLCEWAGLRQAGGGVIPIVGCAGNQLSAEKSGNADLGYLPGHLHHGPDKNTLNNAPGTNLHRLCAVCHNRWHAANNEFYSGERPEAQLDAQAVTLTIELFLQAQTRENRQLFLRRYYYGDSVRRLSGLFGLTENTVKSRLFRLRAGLRDALLKEGIAV